MSGGEERCGARTKAGGRCQWPAGECPWHGGRRRRPVPAQRSERSLPRDPAALAWWAIGEVVAGRLDPRAASVVAALLRVLTKLESNELPAEAAAAAALLRGRLLHGVPPATP
ncbi:MAG: hypothetical protein RMK15_07010, partial [Chloroflexota bacterium]|nr:hypothetical protein [Chloroflexota bacterium]